MAELSVESHTAGNLMPVYKALLTILAFAFCLPAVARAQYPPESATGPTLTPPTSAPVVTEPASGSVILAPANRPAIQQIPPGPVVTKPAASVLSSPAAAAPSSDTAKEMVVEVRVIGNTLPLEKIKPFIRTREGRPFDKDLVAEDVHRLDSSKMFVNIKTYFQIVPGGRIVIFEVLERPILLDVKFVGNSKISKKRLQKEAGLKAGDPLDPFAVEEARRKIEEFYRSKGYDKARVTLLEGDKPQDHRAIFLVNEGVKQKVEIVTFVGNNIASDARLRTQIKTKHPIIYLFSGELDRKELDEDVERLTAYYRGLGFFRRASAARSASTTAAKTPRPICWHPGHYAPSTSSKPCNGWSSGSSSTRDRATKSARYRYRATPNTPARN